MTISWLNRAKFRIVYSFPAHPTVLGWATFIPNRLGTTSVAKLEATITTRWRSSRLEVSPTSNNVAWQCCKCFRSYLKNKRETVLQYSGISVLILQAPTCNERSLPLAPATAIRSRPVYIYNAEYANNKLIVGKLVNIFSAFLYTRKRRQNLFLYSNPSCVPSLLCCRPCLNSPFCPVYTVHQAA